MIYRCSRCGCLYNSNSEKNQGYCKECRAEYNKSYKRTEKGREARRHAKKRYDKSEKGKETNKRYEQSKKGKEAHKRAQKRYDQSKKGKETKKRGSHKRRAMKKNVLHEDWTPSEIFKRDQGICHICGLPVYDYEDAPDALKPEYDHYVPIARLGNDTPDNVMLSHAYCNHVKSDRWMHEVDREACREHISKVLEELADELL